MGNHIVSHSAHRPIVKTFISSIVSSALGAIASATNIFLFRRIPPNVASFQIITCNFIPFRAPRCVISTMAPRIGIRLRRSIGSLKMLAIHPHSCNGAPRSPVKIRIVKIHRVRGDPKTNESVSQVIHNCPNITFSPINCHGSLVIHKNNPSRGHFCVSKVRVPGVGRFTARKTANKPIDVIGTSLIERVGFCAKTFPTSHSKTVDSILSFHLGRKFARHRSIGTALKTSRTTLDKDKRVKGGAACLCSVHRSCLRLLFGVVNLPFLPGFVSKRIGIGAGLAPHSRLAFVTLNNVSHVRLGVSLGNRDRDSSCVLDCLPGVRRRACAINTDCGRCKNGRVRAIILDRGCRGGGGLGCHSGSRDIRRGLVFHLRSTRRGAALHTRGGAS